MHPHKVQLKEVFRIGEGNAPKIVKNDWFIVDFFENANEGDVTINAVFCSLKKYTQTIVIFNRSKYWTIAAEVSRLIRYGGM